MLSLKKTVRRKKRERIRDLLALANLEILPTRKLIQNAISYWNPIPMTTLFQLLSCFLLFKCHMITLIHFRILLFVFKALHGLVLAYISSDPSDPVITYSSSSHVPSQNPEVIKLFPSRSHTVEQFAPHIDILSMVNL